jgi:NADH-quinone oxidoreductase subunit H
MISYEVSMGLLIMPVLLFSSSANLTAIVMSQEGLYFCVPFFPLCILFFICILAETNRLPFDLPEAESELVSGFNVDIQVLLLLFFSWQSILISYLCLVVCGAIFRRVVIIY